MVEGWCFAGRGERLIPSGSVGLTTGKATARTKATAESSTLLRRARQERRIRLLRRGGCADDDGGRWGGLFFDDVVLRWREEGGVGVSLMEFYDFCGCAASTGIVEDSHHIEIELR